MSERLRVLFSGTVAGSPGQAGATWAVLNWLLGLRRLGHDVWFVEPLPGSELDRPHTAWMSAVARQFDLEGRWALVERDGSRTVGLSMTALRRIARGADLLVNVSGMLADDDLLAAVPTRAYLDLDPGFNQLWQAAEGIDMGFDRHTDHVTVGLRLGTEGCDVPTFGHDWIPTVPPVVLGEWPAQGGEPRRALTTVGNWRSYGSIDHDGRHYGQKAHSIRRLTGIPAAVDVPVEAALDIHPDEVEDLARLRGAGWTLLDPVAAAGTPDAYRDFVQGSWAELGLAKEGYVVSGSGWFSDRSVAYLASGRPVVAQATGFEEVIPVGAGLLEFHDVAGAAEAVADVAGSYRRHADAASDLARSIFASDLVLPALLDRLGCGR